MTSLWLDERVDPRPPLERDVDADVAVVGAGITGIALALALARDGARVVVLEAREVASAASGTNAGFVLAGIGENFVAAARRYGAERAWRVYQLTRRNQARLRALVEEHAIDCELAWNGSLQVAGDGAEWEEVRESARQLAARGVRVSADEAARAAGYADDGEIHPVRLVRGLAHVAERHGARIYERTPVEQVGDGGARAGGWRVKAGAVVVCANAYAPQLVRIRVRPVRGQMLATAPLFRRVFDRPAYAHRGYRYWRQTRDGRVLVGGWRDVDPDVEVGEEEQTTSRIQDALDGFLRSQGVDAPVTHRWAGIMGFSHDALPYAGRLGPGVFVCAGFTGHGNGLAFEAAEIVAALVRDASHPDADLFDPERS